LFNFVLSCTATIVIANKNALLHNIVMLWHVLNSNEIHASVGDHWSDRRQSIWMKESRSHRESATCQRESQQCRPRRPSYSSTLRIGFENVRILRDIRFGQLHRSWNADSSSIVQAMLIGSLKRHLKMI
jgi:hypothetical protein